MNGHAEPLPVCEVERSHLKAEVTELKGQVKELDRLVRRLTLYVLLAAAAGGAAPLTLLKLF